MNTAGIPIQVPEPEVHARSIPTVSLRGAPLHSLTEAQCVQRVVEEGSAGNPGWIITMNLDHLRRFEREPGYADLCERATLLVADGAPLIWESRMQGTPLPQRVEGSNLVWSLAEGLAQRGGSIFLLGGSPGTAQAAADGLRHRFEGLRIAGTACPTLGFEQDESQLKALREQLVKAAPDLVYVALGSPKQELLIDRIRHDLPRAWWIGVGVSFSFMCGQVRRAPIWMQRAGLEWVHRLAQEPGRLVRRYLVDGVPFALLLLAGALGRRIVPRPSSITNHS